MTEKAGSRTHNECCYGAFVRSLPLGTVIDQDRVEATFKKGVLKITLPKTKPDDTAMGRIEVKAG